MTMTGQHVGLIGFGAIAQEVLRLLQAQPQPPRVTVLLRPGSSSRALVPQDVDVVTNLEALLSQRPSLVVEAAGQDAAAILVPRVLAAGVPALVVSTGVFAEDGLLERFSALARAQGTRLLLSAGAIGGLDYLDAAALGGGLQVRYTSRKPPQAWRAELVALGRDAETCSTETLLFEGSAEAAAKLYPRNLNVALTLRLRLGPAVPLTVRVMADPMVSQNTHEVEAQGNLGTATLRFANMPSAMNPKTSALTSHALAAEIMRALENRL